MVLQGGVEGLMHRYTSDIGKDADGFVKSGLKVRNRGIKTCKICISVFEVSTRRMVRVVSCDPILNGIQARGGIIRRSPFVFLSLGPKHRRYVTSG